MAGNLIYHTVMHSSRELSSSSFEVRVDGRPARLEDLFDGFGEQDRLGVVMSRPCGAVGASALITATITAFYDLHRARGREFFAYPDYYLFHVGRPLGDHARLDVWPRRKEVVVGAEPQAILEAIDDRAITRLVVEDGEPAEAALDDEVMASARGRIRTCLAYSPAGRVGDADVEIASNPVTEGYVEAILDPETRIARLRAEAGGERADAVRSGAAADAVRSRALCGRIASIESRLGEVERDVRSRILRGRRELLRDGVPVETYRRIGLDEALGLLGSPTAVPAG
ncbi:MAG TPA: hypothetical protein VGW14_07085 [Thermoleophilaceae bacterium]|nr:hypothetical protein [Thermoleophilaceae bacterium]